MQSSTVLSAQDSGSTPPRTLGTPTEGYWTGSLGALLSVVPETLVKAAYTGSLPSSFSWSGWDGASTIGTNYMTPVRNQGGCGSCWAFAAIGDMEGQYQISKGKPSSGIDLSEQNVLQCSGGTCGGTSIDVPLNYLWNSGTPDEACNPYNAADHPCGTGRCPDYLSRTYKITGWSWIPIDTASVKSWLYTHGPVIVWMNVYSDFPWSSPDFWKTSYYGHTHDACTNCGHFVVIVGWNDAGNPNGYWIVRNSWGTSGGDTYYGQGGYFYMSMGTTDGFFDPAHGWGEAAVISDVSAPAPPRAGVSQPYVLGFKVSNVYSDSAVGDYSYSTTGWSASDASFQVTLAEDESVFLIGTAQVWNDQASVGSSICNYSQWSSCFG